MERFVVLPFSIGCTSQSSIDVIGNPSSAKKSKHEAYPSSITRVQGEGGGDNSSGVKVKNSLTRLIKSIKTISQLFVYREDEEEEEEEIEIEIGFPTDVIHVTHIGWDGSTTTTNTNSNNATTTNLFSSQTNSLSLNQFEFAMARPRHADHVGSSRAPSLVFGPSTNNPKSTSS